MMATKNTQGAMDSMTQIFSQINTSFASSQQTEA